MRGALDVHRELLARAVPHEVVRLRSRVLTADDLPRVMGLERGCAAVRCYLVERHGDASFAATLVPAGTVPSPRRLLEALDACSVRPAPPDQVNSVTDYVAGLVCPVGLAPAVELVVDTAVERNETSYCALGEGGVALGIRTRDLLGATGARVASLTEPGEREDEEDAQEAPVEGHRVIDLALEVDLDVDLDRGHQVRPPA